MCNRCVNKEGSGLAVSMHALRHHRDKGGNIGELKIWGTKGERFGDPRVSMETRPDKAWVLKWDGSKVVEEAE